MAKTILSRPRPGRRRKAPKGKSPGKQKKPPADTPVSRAKRNDQYG